jgi:hypothetical protein
MAHDAAPVLLRRPQSFGQRDSPLLLPRPGRGPNPRPLILRRPDVVTIVTIFLALQFLIPARLVIGNLGAAGRPSLVLALGIGLLWISGFFQRGNLQRGGQPVRWLMGAFVVVQVLSYAAGYDRGLPGVEARSADRWMIVTFALAGLAVAVADGVVSRKRLDDLLSRLVGFTGVMAVIGILQAVAGIDLTRYIRPPGLRLNAGLIGVGERGATDLARVASTANHYIEFGVVLGMVLPIALHRALYAETPGQRQWRWLMVVLIAGAVPLSLSRSGLVALVASMAVLSVVWTWRFRARALVGALIGAVVFRLLQPGVLGTLRALFVRADDDPSVQNRIADYEYVERVFPDRPWLGRGVGTLLPDRYILLDNQYLNTLLSSGLVGLIAFVGLFVVGYVVARSVRLRGASAETRHLGQALAAALVSAMVCSATFDSLSFATYSGVTFLLIGCAGALWRLDGGPSERRPLQAGEDEAGVLARPWMADRPALAGAIARFPVHQRPPRAR